MRPGVVGMSPAVAVFAAVVAMVVAGGAVMAFTQSGPGTTTSTSSTATSTTPGIQGVVTGYVTVGPAQPVCMENQSCNVDLTGYSLVFTPACPGQASGCSPILAQISPSGHYSVLLAPGDYLVTGLSPSCNWMGCASAFPKTVTVVGGTQLVLDVTVDTGIR